MTAAETSVRCMSVGKDVKLSRQLCPKRLAFSRQAHHQKSNPMMHTAKIFCEQKSHTLLSSFSNNTVSTLSSCVFVFQDQFWSVMQKKHYVQKKSCGHSCQTLWCDQAYACNYCEHWCELTPSVKMDSSCSHWLVWAIFLCLSQCLYLNSDDFHR